MKLCEIDGCSRPRRKRNWCETHYSRFRVHGDPMKGARTIQASECIYAGCSTKPLAKNLCRKHYYRSKKAPKVLKQPKIRSLCSVEECTNISVARGWCGAHYQRWRRFGNPEYYVPEPNTQCRIKGCNRTVNARGLCGPHYYRWSRYGDPEFTEIRKTPNRPTLPDRICKTCGAIFSPGTSTVRKYCGRKCSRARRGGSVNRRAWVNKLGDRDGWICHLCLGAIQKELNWPNGQAGSVDHIIPVSHGGDDSPENLAIAHLTCNTSRKNRLLDPPL